MYNTIYTQINIKSEAPCRHTDLHLVHSLSFDKHNRENKASQQRYMRLYMPLIKVLFRFYPWTVLFFLNNWNRSELLIDLSAHYNADLGQDEIKVCRQLPYPATEAPWVEWRLLIYAVKQPLRWMEIGGKEFNLVYCFVHLMAISITRPFHGRHTLGCGACRACMFYDDANMF